MEQQTSGLTILLQHTRKEHPKAFPAKAFIEIENVHLQLNIRSPAIKCNQ
eukprot:gene12767-biopygen16408